MCSRRRMFGSVWKYLDSTQLFSLWTKGQIVIVLDHIIYWLSIFVFLGVIYRLNYGPRIWRNIFCYYCLSAVSLQHHCKQHPCMWTQQFNSFTASYFCRQYDHIHCIIKVTNHCISRLLMLFTLNRNKRSRTLTNSCFGALIRLIHYRETERKGWRNEWYIHNRRV